MIDGNAMWDLTKFPNIITTEINGRLIRTFADLPLSAYHSLSDSAGRLPQKIAIIDDEGRTYTYSRLLEHVDAFASYLQSRLGICSGDNVALAFYSNIEFCVAFLALSKLAAVAVLLPNKYKQAEMLSLVEKVDIKCIICESVFQSWFTNMESRGVSVLAAAPDSKERYGFGHLCPEDSGTLSASGNSGSNAMILFTSGTTAQSKAVLLKNYNIMHAVVAYNRILNVTSEDKTIIPIPIYTITGTVAILTLFLYSGGTIYLHKKFDAKRVLNCMVENHLTFFHASPTVFALLLDHRDEFPLIPDMRRFACGSSNMPAGNILRLKKWIPSADFHTVYGLTETSSPATVFPCGAADSPFIGSSGLPIPGVELMIADDHGTELEAGQVGEIYMRGVVLLERYLVGGEDAFTKDGWFRSGDLGYIGEQGYLYVVDRKKGIINRGGEKICCFDVENALHSQPGIIEAALVGIPHPLYGEEPVAVVRLESGYSITERDIIDSLTEKLPKYMIPTQIRFVEKILKTPNGKVDKRGIRDQFLTQEASSC